MIKNKKIKKLENPSLKLEKNIVSFCNQTFYLHLMNPIKKKNQNWIGFPQQIMSLI